MTALRLDAVNCTRGRGRRAVRAVRAVSLEVAPGEVVLLRGPSGSGKTTLLALAAGLLPPEGGTVTVAGLRLDQASAAGRRAWRAQNVGLVFQRGGLASHLTALENVRLMAELAGATRVEAARQAEASLATLGLSDRAGQRPRELSGGEEMRVSVARALVHRPALVLADEPTANLDSSAGRQVADCLLQAAREQGAGVLIATHDDRLLGIASRLLHLLDGRLVDDPGAPATAFFNCGRIRVCSHDAG
jgi:putative ABC transport system ATP-binding protein